MVCKLNCFGEAATPVPLLPGGTDNGVPAEDLDTCRDFCLGTTGCEAIVYGQQMCYGKKNVHTGKCQPSNGDFVTESLTRLPKGTCIIMGDPHILTFDNPLGGVEDNTQLAAGDYVVLTSDSFTIHGRFGFCDRFPSESSLTGLTIGGVFMRGQTLTVEYRGGGNGPDFFKVFLNTTEIIPSLGSRFASPDGFLTATKDMMNPDDFHRQARHTIGGTSGTMPSILLKIAPAIEIYILLGDQTMNAVITMERLPGKFDGYCGNFNCDASDDTLPQLKTRGFADPVAKSLFTLPPASIAAVVGAPVKTINDCSPELLASAEKSCAGVVQGLKEGCVYDVCVSGSAEMGKEDAVTAGVAAGMSSKFTSFLGLQLPGFRVGSLAPQLQGMLALGVMAFAGAGLAAGLSSRNARSARGNFSPLRDQDLDPEEALLLAATASEHDPISGAE